jgi:hypothetical protein
MSNVKPYTDQELQERIESLPSFKGYPNGILDVWVRSNEDEFDRFDDKVYTFDCSSGIPIFVMVCSGTTNAGAVGLKHFAKYNGKGCAVLQSDVIVYDSHIFGFHKGKYPAYIQSNKPFPHFRDANKDNKADETGKIYTDRIGANCHHAGVWSTAIGGWSVACLVRNKLSEWNEWLKLMTKKGRKPLTVVILKEF